MYLMLINNFFYDNVYSHFNIINMKYKYVVVLALTITFCFRCQFCSNVDIFRIVVVVG